MDIAYYFAVFISKLQIVVCGTQQGSQILMRSLTEYSLKFWEVSSKV